VREALENYKREYNTILWCGHFADDANTSFALSPDILAKLGEFGVEVFVDTYFSARG
jgi:hypothetical protein